MLQKSSTTLESLPPKQRDFVLHYCREKNATKAAKLAGYSKNTAEKQAGRLLGKVGIQNAIQAFTQPILEEAGVSVKALVDEWAKIAFAQPEDFKEMQMNTQIKLAAGKMLGEYLGMFSQPPDAAEKPPSLNFHMGMSGEESRQALLAYLKNRRK